MNGKIVIVDDEPITRMDIHGMLKEANYNVVGEASDGFEAIELCKMHQPDLVIMDVQMPILDGVKASKRIIADRLTSGVILLTAFSDKKTVEKVSAIGVLGYIVKPLDEKSFIPMLKVTIARGKEIRKLEHDLSKLSQKMEERKAVERAKGILMKESGYSEEEAYQILRKLSMDRRCPMMEIATTIVISYE